MVPRNILNKLSKQCLVAFGHGFVAHRPSRAGGSWSRSLPAAPAGRPSRWPAQPARPPPAPTQLRRRRAKGRAIREGGGGGDGDGDGDGAATFNRARPVCLLPSDCGRSRMPRAVHHVQRGQHVRLVLQRGRQRRGVVQDRKGQRGVVREEHTRRQPDREGPKRSLAFTCNMAHKLRGH